MEALLSRYRNLTVLLVVVVSQLLYLAWQVKSNRDERLIRVWAVTAVTPMAGIVEAVRHNTIGFLEDYFILLDVRDQNRKLKADNDHLRLENIFLRNQLNTADHAEALTLFQKRTPSKTVAAQVIGNSTVATAKAVFIDRGETSGILKGMAVVTPEGIVGKVAAVYPLVSQVLLVTDPTFKVGIESQNGHVHGVLDCGSGKCVVEQVQNEDKVDPGEWFFTSGEDRIFPRGFPVGAVLSSKPGQGMRDIGINLSGAPGGVEQVLVILQGVHQEIPQAPVPPPVELATAPSLQAPPPDATDPAHTGRPQTEADKVVEHYQEIGKDQNHEFGAYGSSLPNFNKQAVPASATTTAPPTVAPGSATVAKPASKPSAPAILGARPGATSPAPASPAPKSEPSGLLGSPKHKPDANDTQLPKTLPGDE